VDEHVLSAIIADDEAESFLRIEKFDDAFAFADDLGGHSATTGTAAAEPAAAATAAKATAPAAVAAATFAKTSAVAKSAATGESAGAALLVPEITEILFAETFALVAAATTAIPLAPSIETHACPNFRVPAMI
jgi:hypothetical protein